MTSYLEKLDQISISVKSNKLLKQLFHENPRLKNIIMRSRSSREAQGIIREWILSFLKKRNTSYKFYTGELKGREAFKQLTWRDYAAIRILDYIDYACLKQKDLNIKNRLVYSNPFRLIWLAAKKGVSGAKPYFFIDMIYLFRQFMGRLKQNIPEKNLVNQWMDKWKSGLDEEIMQLQEANKRRIIKTIIRKINRGTLRDEDYFFEAGLTEEEKYARVMQWWNESKFHLRFAIRSAGMLNEFLNNSLDHDTMDILSKAEKKGIPFFVNPYYLSLLLVNPPEHLKDQDLALRGYILYSKELVEEFGNINAWEKEDEVKPGKPNTAGWILPTKHNIHRRYPEVSILIPDTQGRACGGLCSSCQRMYDFQSGNLNFNLNKLKPKERWNQKLEYLLNYFEQDSQLRDILITGGDALMSSDTSLKDILNSIYNMAFRKKEANKKRKEGEKFAEIQRIRLGTRLPIYLPQRIDEDLVNTLRDFKQKASSIGIRQFVIQTHFQSLLEITPESVSAVKKIISAGWIINNQHVFTAASSRRGHADKLRKVLNDIGVLTYYTFSVKGYMENYESFATNERAIQEQIEEKYIGKIGDTDSDKLTALVKNPQNMPENINALRKELNIPFLSTDKTVMNLPGVGKSLTYRTIGITRYGRRILKFSHDETRKHSPIIQKMPDIIIIESKSIGEYLDQLDSYGEDIRDYQSLWGYSLAETEVRSSIFEYPDYDFQITDKITNFQFD